MATLIGKASSGNFGEDLFIAKAIEYLDDSCIIYRNRQVNGLEFDICILIPEKGILIVEIKGWREDSIVGVDNSGSVVISTPDGEVSSSPQRQARGYRYAIQNMIRRAIGKHPLVFQMVCLPQISSACFDHKRLDVAMEKGFTILKEDLQSREALFSKMNQALTYASQWNRNSFDERTMLEVRSLFEAGVVLPDLPDIESKSHCLSPTERNHYSMLSFFSSPSMEMKDALENLGKLYLGGCKLICVFATREQLLSAVSTIDRCLGKNKIVRHGGDLQLAFDQSAVPTPKAVPADSFSGFHFSFSVLKDADRSIDSFTVYDGEYSSQQKQNIEYLGAHSGLNVEQYFVEHSKQDQNVVIRAGAGTGKTYTMISRIGYLCYMQNAPLESTLDRIVMITFTNEAADQMSEKLKLHFKNMFLLTSDSAFLSAVSYVEKMRISTIHSYARTLIAELGSEFGYGFDVGITSSDYHRRKIIAELLDQYIREKQRENGNDYLEALGMPAYMISEKILSFINTLHNKNVDVEDLTEQAMGNVSNGSEQTHLHTLFSVLIPAVEKAYNRKLLDDNQVHLGSIISVLNRLFSRPESAERLKELSRGGNQYMFVDEFQDTDDTQIDIILRIADLLCFKLFLVGDIKQCIYRFRGAEEKAFDRLPIDSNPEAWAEFQLQLNYRTDRHLLDIFDKSFSAWGDNASPILVYGSKDRLIGVRDFNGYIPACNKYYNHISISSEQERIRELIKELSRLQKRIAYEQVKGHSLSQKDKTIAILVRENWQAELIKRECEKIDRSLTIHTKTGGDLYMSQPALDLMVLVNALVHFDEADYLYNLATSNFFSINLPKSNLFNLRKDIRNRWRTKTSEREQSNYIIREMNRFLVDLPDESTWDKIIVSLRNKPVLQIIRDIYETLMPWNRYSSKPWEQQYYRLNVDLLFEELINSCNVDHLTINTLKEHLYHRIISRISVDSRMPPEKSSETRIECITVHKAKGLEYGYVILPFCSFPIDTVKKEKLHISIDKHSSPYKIGYNLTDKATNTQLQNDYYSEQAEKEEVLREEARILYVAMTRAIRSFSWIDLQSSSSLSWQRLISTEVY